MPSPVSVTTPLTPSLPRIDLGLLIVCVTGAPIRDPQSKSLEPVWQDGTLAIRADAFKQWSAHPHFRDVKVISFFSLLEINRGYFDALLGLTVDERDAMIHELKATIKSKYQYDFERLFGTK